MSEHVALRELSSPLGTLRLAVTARGVVRLAFPRSVGKGFRGWLQRHLPDAESVDWLPPIEKVEAELDEYFSGRRTEFAVPLDLRGTAFQRAVWEDLLGIPYGELRNYGEVARAIGRPNASRAVGAAVGANPVPILVPCHRVIGASGRLTGYGGGLQVKRKLLALERSQLPKTTLI
jgi:O-6-methylguanine DNA methyltransferase